MSAVNDYIKRYNDTMGVNEQNAGSNVPTSTGNDDVYKLARDQEYDLLFDKEVALENAKANALKYTQNQINAQGFGGTGYGSTLQSGIYNTYLSKANEAQVDYANNIRDINLQEQQAQTDQANDRFQSVTTMLQGADTLENMNTLLKDYGYGTIDKDGNFTWNATKPEGMSDDDWYQMQYYYRMKANDFAQTSQNRSVFDYNSHFIYYDKDGNVQRREGTGEGWNWEVDSANAYVASGDFANGSYVMLENESGEKIYLTVQNGQLYYATKDEFDKNGGYKIKGTNRTYTKVNGQNN